MLHESIVVAHCCWQKQKKKHWTNWWRCVWSVYFKLSLHKKQKKKYLLTILYTTKKQRKRIKEKKRISSSVLMLMLESRDTFVDGTWHFAWALLLLLLPCHVIFNDALWQMLRPLDVCLLRCVFFCWRSFSHFSLCIMCILLRNRLVHQCRVDGIGGCSAPFSISLRLAVFPSVFLFDKIGEIFEWFTWWDQDEKSAPWMNTKNDEKEQKNYPSKWANIVIV